MSSRPRDERRAGEEPGVEPAEGLTLTLWVIAALLAAIELVWWWADMIYSA
jgi:hypothetical protein